MKTTLDYIEAIKKQHRVESDYAVAKLLGVGHSRVSHYRVGRSVFDEHISLKVGELLNINPLEVLANVRAERAKDDQVRKVWLRLAAQASRLAPSVGAVVLTAGLLGTSLPSPAQASQVFDSFNKIYIMRSLTHARKASSSAAYRTSMYR